MLTKSIYCGDNWEFQITQDDTGVSLDLKSKSHNIQKWEIEELRDFINQYLGQTDNSNKEKTMNISNVRDFAIILAALDLYRDYLENDDHAPTTDSLPYTIEDIKNLYERINANY